MTDLSPGPQGRAAARHGGPSQTGGAGDGSGFGGDGSGGFGSSGGAGGGYGEGAPPPGGRAALRKARKKKHKGLKILGGVTAGVILVAAGGGYYEWHKLNANITSAPLHSKDAPHLTEKADAFGRTPINILVMGSDSRSTAEDCKLGGACDDGQGGQRADVEMVVHISADRTNATVMSIPRDLLTPLPSCAGGGTGMINSALSGGTGCQVDAVEKLTGIPIDHFVEVTFSGVVSVSDAVGGVNVCVSSDVYDTNSHLKLTKGEHTLKGDGALEFLRTRDAFTDGSDIGRTDSQHMFLSSALQKMKSAGTLTNPFKLDSLANAATKAITVDPGLDGVTKLIGLAKDVNKVPTKRMTFVTMQTHYGTGADSGRALISPGATDLFQTIADDTPLTTASGAKSGAAKAESSASASASPSATATVDTSGIAVQVENGTSVNGAQVPNRASTVVQQLEAKGFSKDSAALDGPASATSTLTYPSADTAQAKAVAAAVGLPATALKPSATAQKYTLVIGNDWKTGAVYPESSASAEAVNTQAALSGAVTQNGADTKNCADVGNYENIPVGLKTAQTTAGQQAIAAREMFCNSTNCYATPAEAYALFPNVKDSDS